MSNHASTSDDAVRVVSSVQPNDSNPYFRLFYQALHAHGIELVGTFVPSRRWLSEHREEFDVLHFHWPEWMMRSEPRWSRWLSRVPGGWRARLLLRRVMPWVRLLEYKAFLRGARASGKRIAWTCHNVEPHEDRSWPIRSAFQTLAGKADLVICHDEHASSRCQTLYAPGGRIVVMPFGNYDGVYPQGRPRAEVLGEVGLAADLPVLLCIGQVRPYKGTDVACNAVAELGDTVSLLVAGSAPIPSYHRRIKKLVAALPNAVFINRELTDQEFSDFVRASDVVLLPYRSVTGSSAALAALTLGRGVIASDMPFFASLVHGHPNAARVFASGDPQALAEAIRGFLEVPAAERERAARRLAARFDWAQVASPVARSLRSLVRPC